MIEFKRFLSVKFAISWFKRHSTRMIKFSIVGLSGVLVQLGTLYLLKEFIHIPPEIASPIAIELSILNNFIWNDLWTWHDRKQGKWRVRCLKYHSSVFISALINYAVFVLLYRSFHTHYILSSAVGIGAGAGLNFFVNHLWTYGTITKNSNENLNN